MKNKKLIYILLPLTAIIWGMIVYRIFFDTNAQEESSLFVQNKSTQNRAVAPPDTFELLLNYPDPFLKHERRVIPNTDVSTTKKEAEPKPQKPAEVVNWPAIKYGGLVRQVNQENELAIVTINGSSQLMKTGETVNDIKLIKIYNDSIIVSFQTQKRTIKK